MPKLDLGLHRDAASGSFMHKDGTPYLAGAS
jgi:hypothetical protein